jgi:hypothetical protein
MKFPVPADFVAIYEQNLQSAHVYPRPCGTNSGISNAATQKRNALPQALKYCVSGNSLRCMTTIPREISSKNFVEGARTWQTSPLAGATSRQLL